MITIIKKALPSDGDYLRGGVRLALINLLILLIVLGGPLGIFFLIDRVKKMGLPIPQPIWLVLLITSIPCFIFWFQYGKAFGAFIQKRRFSRGLALGIIGDIPGFIVLFISLDNLGYIASSNILKTVFVIYIMYLILMPIMVTLGTFDKKQR